MTPYKSGYARVGALERDEALQCDALYAAGSTESSLIRPVVSSRLVSPWTTYSPRLDRATPSSFGGWTDLGGPSSTSSRRWRHWMPATLRSSA